MSVPYAAIDDDTADLLSLIADETNPVGHDAVDLFLGACEADARDYGYVSVPRVRMRLRNTDIDPKRVASFWGHFTGPGRPMVRIDGYDANDGGTTRNGNKVYPRRKWLGTPA